MLSLNLYSFHITSNVSKLICVECKCKPSIIKEMSWHLVSENNTWNCSWLMDVETFFLVSFQPNDKFSHIKVEKVWIYQYQKMSGTSTRHTYGALCWIFLSYLSFTEKSTTLAVSKFWLGYIYLFYVQFKIGLWGINN